MRERRGVREQRSEGSGAREGGILQERYSEEDTDHYTVGPIRIVKTPIHKTW